jgi:hypothetical protein
MTDITTRSSPQDAPGRGASPAQQAKEEATGVAASAKDEAANVASTAKSEAASVAQTAVEEAKHLGSEATQQAKHVLTDARQQLQVQAEEQSQRLGGAVRDLGQQLRTMAEAGQPGLARDLMSQAADTAQRFSQQLQQGGVDRTLQDAKRFARNRPGMFLLGAAAAGFAAARVARNVDTEALKEAATPDGNDGANGHSGGTRYGAGVQWAGQTGSSQPRPAPASQGNAGGPPSGAITAPAGPPGATPPASQRPLVADPPPSSTPEGRS